MATKLNKEPFFAVALDGIKFSQEQLNRIDSGIKELVMREIAKIDHKGDIVVNKKIELYPLFEKFKNIKWLGIWINGYKSFRELNLVK